MVQMFSLNGLALLFGMWVASLGRAHPTGLVPVNMQADIKKLKDYFIEYNKENRRKWFSNQPLFLTNPDDVGFKLAGYEKNLLMGEMLNVSQQALASLQNHTTDAEMRKTIRAIQGRVDKLQENFPAMKREVQGRLQGLWALKTDEFMTQLQALGELDHLYSKGLTLRKEAQEMQLRKRRRRRRSERQALRRKVAHPL